MNVSFSEQEAIARASYDQSAFLFLYQKHVEEIYRFFAFRLADKADAEDLTSKVWEIILKKIDRFKPKKNYSFRAWIFRIARNALFDFYREQKKAALPLEESLHIQDKNPLPSEVFKHKEDFKQIQALMETLPRKQKEVLALYFFSELNHSEIAATLKIKPKTVSTHLCRSLQALNKRIYS